MGKKAKAKSKGMSKTTKKVFVGVGIAALVLVLGGMAFQINDLDKTDEVNATFGYEQGLLSTVDGGEIKGTTSIRTKDFFKLDDLNIELKDDASIVYQVFWYNADEEFISCTEELSADFSGAIPEDAEFGRVMITPENDPEVSVGEIAGYAGELTIEWKK